MLRHLPTTTSTRIQTAIVTLILIFGTLSARADSLILSNLVAGELLTQAHGELYSGYRQGDPGASNRWYRWVVKVEKTGPEKGQYNFKWHVPDDFARDWRDMGDGFQGLLIQNQAGWDYVVNNWNGVGSTNEDIPGPFTKLYRVFDGWDEMAILTSNNYFTIEYLAREGTHSGLQTNGFELSSGGNGTGDWLGYITNAIATPTTYVPTPPGLQASNLVVTAQAFSASAVWQNGDGWNRMLIVRECVVGAWLPVDGQTYAATNDYSGAVAQSDGSRIVYNGSGTNVEVTGLSATTRYGFQVIEYTGNGAETRYLTNGVAAQVNVVTASIGVFEHEANRVVNIWEAGWEPGKPGVDGTNLFWTIAVWNNSNLFPPIDEVKLIRLHSLYSATEPTVDSGGHVFWVGMVLPSARTNQWDVTIVATHSIEYIPPGEGFAFTVVTTIPSTNDSIRIGPRYGQVDFDGRGGYEPPTPGDAFLGPVGLEPRTGQVFNCSVSTNAVMLTLTNLTPTCSNFIERCTDLRSNDWSTVAAFPTVSEATNWTDWLTNGFSRCFYRLRSVAVE